MTTWQFFCYIILWIALMHHMKCYLNITRNHITHCLRVLFLITITLTRRSGKQKSDTFMQTMSSKPNNKHWILHLCLYISDIMFALKEYHISPVQLGNIQLSSHPFGHTPFKLLQTAPSLHFPHSLSQYSPWKPCSQSLKTCVNIINWDVRLFMIV